MERAPQRRWRFLVVVLVLAAPVITVGYLRYTTIPIEQFPAEVRDNAGWLHGPGKDRKTPLRGTTRAKFDHFINPLPDFHRPIMFAHVFTSPQFPGERFLVFYEIGVADSALAYRCAADGRLISKGALDVSP